MNIRVYIWDMNNAQNNNDMKTYEFLCSAIEAAAANANVNKDEMSNQTLDIVYSIVEVGGSAKFCGQFIKQTKSGSYTVTPVGLQSSAS